MGSKTRARQAMQAAGVPIIPGTTDPVGSAEEVAALGEEIGYPLLIKAAAGGGGKGMKVVARRRRGRSRPSSRRSARARSYFADAAVYVERYLEDPRHVEVQVLADAHGNVIHLGERDCTIQRRHQKLVEETPSPAVGPELRERIGQHRRRRRARRRLPLRRDDRGAARAGRRLLLHGDEHAHPGRAHGHRARHRARPRPRAGARSPPASRSRCARRTSICAATRSSAGSTPRTRRTASCRRPGRITRYREPAGPGVRVDSGVAAGSEISAALRPDDREADRARRRPRDARGGGCCARSASSRSAASKTLVGFHRALLEHPCFVAGETCHGLVESRELAARAARALRRAGRSRRSRDGADRRALDRREVDGRRVEVKVLVPERRLPRARPPPPRACGAGGAARRAPARSSARCRARCSR